MSHSGDRKREAKSVLSVHGLRISGHRHHWLRDDFFLPLARGMFSAPPIIHVHGALLFAWLLFFIAQAWLIQSGSVLLHRRLGMFGVLLCLAIVVSGVLVGLSAIRRDLAAGGDRLVLGNFVNILIEMLLFGSLVAAAIAVRRDSRSS